MRRAVRGKFEDRLLQRFAPKCDFDDAPFTPLPPPAGGEGRVRGADEPVRGAAHLTLPSLREGPLPLPPKGGEGPVPGTQRGSLGGEGQRSSLLRGAECGEALLRIEDGGTLLGRGL